LLGVIFPLLIGFGSMILLGFEIVESLFVATAILATSIKAAVADPVDALHYE
jgi:Kef-type K+ transport system membrane component KefB